MSEEIEYGNSGRVVRVGEAQRCDGTGKDTRIVFGARCTWWGNVAETGAIPVQGHARGLPCCPHCHGVLFELSSEADWFAAVDQYEREGHPGYRAMVEWTRGRCFKNYDKMSAAYAARKGGAS